ncbi:hypothetical protein, partial [Xanthomonas sacchari]|uniref:hypothetical protein n=1 Tax=Xanthomonas sacchari TaxID=56458 RepID=UPI00225E6B04
GAVTAGFGAAASGAAALSNPVVQAMATGAVGNLSTYAANQLVGNDVGFSWRSVAASVVSAGITAKLAPSLTGFLDPTSSAAQFQAGLIRGIAGGIVSAHVRKELIGGDVDYQNVLADAFGNVLGEALSGEYAQRAAEAGSVLATRTAYVGAGTDDRNLFAGGGGGPGSPYPEDLRARVTGDNGTRREPDERIEVLAQDIRTLEAQGRDMSEAWGFLDEYRQRTYAGSATTVATTNDNITTLETVQVRPEFADTAELWRQQAASYDAVGSFISQLAQNGHGSVPDYAGAATAWVQAPKQYELDYFRQHGTAMPAVSDSG